MSGIELVKMGGTFISKDGRYMKKFLDNGKICEKFTKPIENGEKVFIKISDAGKSELAHKKKEVTVKSLNSEELQAFFPKMHKFVKRESKLTDVYSKDEQVFKEHISVYAKPNYGVEEMEDTRKILDQRTKIKTEHGYITERNYGDVCVPVDAGRSLPTSYPAFSDGVLTGKYVPLHKFPHSSNPLESNIERRIDRNDYVQVVPDYTFKRSKVINSYVDDIHMKQSHGFNWKENLQELVTNIFIKDKWKK